eukprot:Colp12_sorted_trinity150504_noHs@25839
MPIEMNDDERNIKRLEAAQAMNDIVRSKDLSLLNDLTSETYDKLIEAGMKARVVIKAKAAIMPTKAAKRSRTPKTDTDDRVMFDFLKNYLERAYNSTIATFAAERYIPDPNKLVAQLNDSLDVLRDQMIELRRAEGTLTQLHIVTAFKLGCIFKQAFVNTRADKQEWRRFILSSGMCETTIRKYRNLADLIHKAPRILLVTYGTFTTLLEHVPQFNKAFDLYPDELARWSLTKEVEYQYLDPNNHVVMRATYGPNYVRKLQTPPASAVASDDENEHHVSVSQVSVARSVTSLIAKARLSSVGEMIVYPDYGNASAASSATDMEQ